MVIQSNEKIILGLCKVSLTPEYPVVSWTSTDTLTLPAGMQLLSLSFLECWDAGMQNMENSQASSKLSLAGKTGQSWGCVIYKTSRRLCISVAPGKSTMHCSQGFLSSSSLLLRMESKALFWPCAKSAVCFYPTSCYTGVHWISLERTWRAGPWSASMVHCVLATSVQCKLRWTQLCSEHL